MRPAPKMLAHEPRRSDPSGAGDVRTPSIRPAMTDTLIGIVMSGPTEPGPYETIFTAAEPSYDGLSVASAAKTRLRRSTVGELGSPGLSQALMPIGSPTAVVVTAPSKPGSR